MPPSHSFAEIRHHEQILSLNWNCVIFSILSTLHPLEIFTLVEIYLKEINQFLYYVFPIMARCALSRCYLRLRCYAGIWSVVPCPVSVHQPSVPPNIFILSLVNTKVMAASIKPGGCGDWGGFIPQPDNILETGAGDLSLAEIMRVNDTRP